MSFIVDAFHGCGVRKTMYFQTEEAARVYAKAAHSVYPESAIFVLRDDGKIEKDFGKPIFECLDIL